MRCIPTGSDGSNGSDDGALERRLAYGRGLMVAPWPREGYVVGGGAGEIVLIALSAAELPDPLPVSRTRHGMPDDGDGAGAVALTRRDRAADPAWFSANILSPFSDL